ncbi:MAG: DUF695 domain-containing protein [Sphingomonas sp.]
MATMVNCFSVAGDGAEWAVFACDTKTGRRAIVRSRLPNQALHDFGIDHHLARVRMTLAEADVTDTGMPRSTAEIDEFEDRVLAALEQAGAQTYLLAVITADGYRDLFFAAVEEGALRTALNASLGGYSFKLALNRIEGTGETLLRSFVPPRR